MSDDPRRRAQRFDLRISAEVQVQGKNVTGTTRNLSVGGCCVEIDRPVAEGTQVQVTLFVVEDDIEAVSGRGLALTGTIQWQAEGDRGYALGIKFAGLTAAQTAALTQALARVTET